ncbi:uncharacterized protein LOC111883956 [Lactuca sativa]|uniref:Protein kinase domain-containing protein n=1 Tax=Lactuca sativa TaxID=4236 RepID=A0A9R1UIE6_LACSA|nr:uncharacterized protein LOC111883956 [Lactuca sativa]XP_023736050.1 uncharacterized protein LOC111883956 [Lactuca sativa]KAJ0187478.1 hypothetical protein LSAT_V11C900504990 [Lactuca sativa]
MWRSDDSLYSSSWSSKPSNLPPPPASSKETGSSSPKGQLCRQFTIDEIRSATQNFKESLLIGTGGFGKLYKGTIKNGTTTSIVAVKQWNHAFNQGAQEFQAEVQLVSMLRHPNIVCLIGYCTDDKEMILVYEYMSNGSLEEHLHKHNTQLSWSQRLQICIDVARALHYLHSGSGQEVIHGNLTSSDILLDSQWGAKITDFGLSKIISFDDCSTHVSTAVSAFSGTLGDIDPEYMATGRLSKKSDVYSFGVVLLEVLCRRRVVDTGLKKEQQGLVRWAQDCVRRGKLKQIIDPELKGHILHTCLNDYVKIVEECLRESQNQRLTMDEVVSGLESILALQERSDHKSIPQMGITTSDWRLDKQFSHGRRNSGGSYFSKVTRLLSAKSLLHKGDHGHISKQTNSPPLSASSKETGLSFPKGETCRRFTISQIRSATQDFNESLVIGKGGFGSVYKGTIKKGTTTTTTVAVKRWKSTSSQGVQEFKTEVYLLPLLQHPNIVCLIGYCTDAKEMILVYEYMSNGSLGDHLNKRITPLSWSQRLKICLEVARALVYLHNGSSGQEVIYNNVKSADILLDNQWVAKIADFGLSKTIPFDDYPTDVISTAVVGTAGYLDPEYVATGRLSKKTDVYSFGVLLLEVLCRRRAIDLSLVQEQVELVRWAQDCLRLGKLEQIIDPELRGRISLKCLNDYVRIVECCLRDRQEPRITMAQVLFGLESIMALHERTDHNSIPQMGITTSDWRLQKYFFSSGENSGGREPEKDFNVIWKPYEMTPMRSIRFSGEDSDQASEPDDEVIVQELPSEEETMKSLYELMQLEYIQRAGGLMRMIDFLHLIWFYPMKKEAEVNFGSLLDKFSSFNKCIRKLQDSSRDERYLMEIQKLLQDIEEDFDDAAFDMVAYLPEGLQVPLASFWSGIPEVHASAIASATQRAISCITDLKVKKLGTAGSGALEIAEILKDMPELRRAFDMVLCVHVKHESIEELMNDIEEEMHLWRKRSLETGSKINVLNKFPNCLLFVDCSDSYIDFHDPEFNLSKWFGTVQIVITENAYCPVDIEIRVEDHLLPWILFSTNVDLETVGKYSEIQQMAAQLIEKCNGHLLAIILLARALRGVVDVGVWVLALNELSSLEKPSSSSSSLEKPSSSSSSQMGVTNDVMVRVLRFIWSRMESLSQRCIVQFTSHYIGSKIKKSSLINSWTKDGLVKGEQEAEDVFEDVIRSFLIEQVGGNCVRMRNEIRVILVTYFVESLPRGYGLYPKQDGSEPNKMPNIEESDAWEIHLSNNIISELPNNPNCPLLVNLFLHFNQDLTDIPVTFFDNMPSLQVLDLSSTSINCLPSSISKLTTLGKLFIRDCDLLMELPPEIGALKNLKVFDSEGTQLVCLPEQFGSLTKLECLKFSLYKQSNQSMQIILAAVLSKLLRLKELSICVDLYGERWEDEVKLIINILPKFRKLKSLTLYFPTTELLSIFMETKSWRKVPIYQHLSNFGFIVGHIQQRLISRVPLDLHKTFVKLPKCFTYTNGEEDLEAISMALTDAAALFLDRHWTLQSLSALGLVEMEKLKFCLLSECNEMLQIVNGLHLEDFFVRPVLGSLQHLSIHYMKSLLCIWNGPIHSQCLSNLKTLAMHSCPELRTIFTQGLLESLTCLECLIIEDCTMINSLVSLGSYNSTSTRYLPSLKKISLLHLPELVSISRGISVAPRLVSLVVYDCPKLEKLSYMKAFDNDIKEIKGENEWWDALKWCEPEWTGGPPNYLANVFIPLGTNGDIMDELADAVNILPHLSD